MHTLTTIRYQTRDREAAIMVSIDVSNHHSKKKLTSARKDLAQGVAEYLKRELLAEKPRRMFGDFK